MSKEELKTINSLSKEDKATLSTLNGEEIAPLNNTNAQLKPCNQLESGLLGWYSICSSDGLKDGKIYNFTMYNEPLIIYRDKDSIARCIKDLCPHRCASFID